MKRLSFRFVRRLMLLLALVFPVVYLMGGFVAALAGSHGSVTLAQDDEVVTSSEIVDFNQLLNRFSGFTAYRGTYSIDGDIATITLASDATGDSFYRSFSYVNSHTYFISVKAKQDESGTIKFANNASVNQSITTSVGAWVTTYFTFTFNGASNAQFNISKSGGAGGNKFYVTNMMCIDLTQMYGVGNEPTAEVFRSRYDVDYYDYTLSSKLVEETSESPTYSEYLFNQILGSDNIIKQWGYYALSDDDKGFAPFASLIQIVDDNFFHLGDSNDLGLFVYGYVYYALNIVAIYELVALVVMVFTIPLKLTDRFTKEM